MAQHSFIRTIYLYIFALLGLVLLIIGAVNFVNMGLKAFVFTQAEEEEKVRQDYPFYSSPPLSSMNLEKYEAGGELTEEEIAAIKSWYQSYQSWEAANSKINYLVSRRHEEAARNLAFILIGLPLYLYHWGVIKKEVRAKEKKDS
jgi:hypothetical protein